MENRLLPPTYFNALLLLMIGTHLVLPIERIISTHSYAGVILIFLGVLLNVWSVGSLQQYKTAIDFHTAPRRLVSDGPFRLSRNPIYLSGVILSLDVAIALGSWISFMFPGVLFVILDRFYVPVEEMILSELFGEEYLAHTQNIRRWI